MAISLCHVAFAFAALIFDSTFTAAVPASSCWQQCVSSSDWRGGGQTFWELNLIFLYTYDECYPLLFLSCTCGCHIGRDGMEVALVVNPNVC